MSIHRYKSTWRSITFNDRYDNTGLVDDPAHVDTAKSFVDYALDSCDINRVSVQDYRELRQFLEGAEPNEAFEGVRAINGQGRIMAADQTLGSDLLRTATLEDMAWALNEAFSVAACRQAAIALTPVGVLPFDFRRANVAAGNKLLRFYARPGPGRPIWVGRRAEGFVRPFSFQLIAFDPFAYDQAAVNTNLGNLAGGANAVSNPGNLYTKPTIVITMAGAGGAAVVITDTTTGKSLTLDLSAMAAGQTLTLDTTRGTIVRDNGANMYSKRVAGYVTDLFLAAGANNITWSLGTNVTSVQFQVRGAYA